METVYLKIQYGPYGANGIIRHKTQRLLGLIEMLSAENYAIDVLPFGHLNRVSITMLGREIFTCDIRNLRFNVPTPDAVSQRALDTVREHVRLFYTTRNRPRFPDISSGMRGVAMPSAPSVVFDIPTPQNSYVIVDDYQHPEDQVQVCAEPVYPYFYDLDSDDLDFVASSSSSVKTREASEPSTKSGLSMYDYWMCDDAVCGGGVTCPPGSLAGDESSEHTMVFGAVEDEERYEEQEVKPKEESEIAVQVLEIEETRSGAVVGRDESEVCARGYRCEECGQCYCICDK